MNAILALAVLLAAAEPAKHLQPGDAAKPFALPASTGQTVQLADYLGQKTVVLAFFPKAFTGG
jgi:peroxiredoxin Q/BCP